LALGLVGTTVVPYNLFLHSALVYNAGEGELKALRKEGAISIFMGGLISMAIVITGKIGEGSTIANTPEMAAVLKNNMGSASLWLFGTGLFAAGFSSALTAPMAAGKVASGLWQHFFLSQKRLGFWIEAAVVILGAWVAIANVNNLWVIKTAQVINGMLLPVFITMILYLLNTRATMKKNKNNVWLNLAGFFVLLVSILLTYKTLVSFFA
jgi:Mn2+/Fe2+ NRAMP family transporter